MRAFSAPLLNPPGRAPAREDMFDTSSEFQAVRLGLEGGGCEDWEGLRGGLDVCCCVERRGLSAGSTASGTIEDFRAGRSRTWLRILDDSGLTGDLAVFDEGGGFVFGIFFESVGVFTVAVVSFDIGLFAVAVPFAGIVVDAALGFTVFAFTGDVADLVDFFLVITPFAKSGASASTGSSITFFGLPLFLAISEDILGWYEAQLEGFESNGYRS